MRIAIVLPLLLLGACQADVDEANDSVTLQYDENAAETVVNETEELAGQVVNDIEETAEKIGNRVDIETDGGNEAGNTTNAN